MIYKRTKRAPPKLGWHATLAEQAGNSPSRLPLKVQKSKVFEYAKGTKTLFYQNFINFTVPKNTRRNKTRKTLVPQLEQITHLVQSKTSQIKSDEKFLNFIQNMSPVSRIVPKTFRSPL